MVRTLLRQSRQLAPLFAARFSLFEILVYFKKALQRFLPHADERDNPRSTPPSAATCVLVRQLGQLERFFFC